MNVLSLFTSNRRAQKVAYKYFQYTKDRDTNTDTGMKYIGDVRTVNVKKKKKSVQISFRLNFDVIRRIFDQLS